MSAQLDLLPECRVPARGTQAYEILMALQSGTRLTVARALTELRVYALSQRIGELKYKYGWTNIRSRMVTLGTARVAEYWIEHGHRHPLD